VSVLLHVSDTHFGTEREAAMAALQQLAERERPAVLVLSGDITQRATAAQFRRARTWLDGLPVPHRLLLPGNHDIPLVNLLQRFAFPYRRYLRWLQPGSLAPELRVAGFHLIGVKTTRRRRHIDGELSPRQIDAVGERLVAADPASLRIVVTHQPLWVDRADDLHNRCRGADLALQRWCAAGADLFLAGHIHWPFVAALPHRHGSWAVNAGTALSHRVRDGVPNSVNLIRLFAGGRDGGCVVERWDCPDGSAQFVRVTVHPLDLRRR
jgi:3',5'-cyclic AMP phosphodiesterase CpdA